MDSIPGAAGLQLVHGVRYLDEETAVFGAMIDGWVRQKCSRRLTGATITARIQLVRRFQLFTEDYPWQWRPVDLE